MTDSTELARQMQLEQAQNTPIYGQGLRSKLEALLLACKIDEAKKMFSCHRAEALKAISEFDVNQHDINNRPDKARVDQPDYKTCKLTRGIQKTTNNVGTFFMFGNAINLTLGNKPEEASQLEPYFEKFNEFLSEMYFNQRMYEARRTAGAETECAKLYAHYTDEDGESHVKCMILRNSENKTLYPLMNQYGDMVAFAVGYYLRNEDDYTATDEHFDVYTKNDFWRFRMTHGGAGSTTKWEMIERRQNPFHKIPVIYYRHETDWDGSQVNVDRLEWVNSKRGDIGDYFGDPYLKVSREIVDNRLAGAREVGKLIEVENESAVFEFVDPPQVGDFVSTEKDDLVQNINQDTLTPDWSYKSIMGLGTLSGEAMRRMNLPGYVKRTNFAVQVYDELIRRELNLIKAILINYVYVDDYETAQGISRLKINFSYVDPFIGGIDDNSTEIATLVGAGAMSIHAAVAANRNIEDKDAEEARIWEEMARKAKIEAEASAAASIASQTTEGEGSKTEEGKE